jgi:hypothetical protein
VLVSPVYIALLIILILTRYTMEKVHKLNEFRCAVLLYFGGNAVAQLVEALHYRP